MNLSHAIEVGSKYKHQVIMSMFDQWGGSCAMGAAYEGTFGKDSGLFKGAMELDATLRMMYPVLREYAMCPGCGEDHAGSVHGIILCLNDNHLWSRKEIAKWVETIENRPRKEEEEEEQYAPPPAPVEPERELVPA
jgi:hypothetical protein